jgi:hypothetical protein
MLIRAFATTTLRIVSLHLLLLLVCGGLLWQQLPRALPVAADWLLEDSGVALVTLAIQPQTYPPYFIDEITLQTGSYHLQARHIYLRQLSPWQFQWRIDVGELTVGELRVGELRVGANDPTAIPEDIQPPTASQAWHSLATGLEQLTQQGSIEHLEYCADGCLAGTINWQRNADQLALQATELGYGVQLALHAVEHNVTVSMVVDATRASASQPRLGQTLGQHLPPRLSIEAHLRAIDNGDLDIQGELVLGAKRQRFMLTEKLATPVQLDVDATLSRINFAAAIPGDSPLESSALQQAADFQLDAQINARWRVEQGETAVTSNSPLTFTLKRQRGDLDLLLNTPIDARLTYPDLNNAAINLAADIRCHVSVNDIFIGGSPVGGCRIPRASFKGDYGDSGDTWLVNTVLTDLSLQSASAGWSANSQARILVNDKRQRVLTMDSQLQASHSQVQLSSDNARAYQLSLKKLSLNHDLTRDQGELLITLDTTLSEVLKLPPLQTLPHLQAVRGKLTGTTRVSWTQQTQSLAQLKVASRYALHKVDVNYDDYQFTGVDLQLALDGWPHMISTTDAVLHVSEVNVGLPLTDINARFAIDMNTDSGSVMLMGHDLSLGLLGGTASSDQWHIDPITQSGFVPFALQDLALQQILALERDDFDSSGRLSGSVPVHIKDGTINVEQGELDAIEPGGYIRYLPDEATRAMLLQSGKTKIVLDTLSDFQYDSLAVLLSYSPAGDLIANTALRGRNPGFEAGREIRFNLSVEQNLGTLLRSMRMSEDVERKIQNRSQKRQNPTPATEVRNP